VIDLHSEIVEGYRYFNRIPVPKVKTLFLLIIFIFEPRGIQESIPNPLLLFFSILHLNNLGTVIQRKGVFQKHFVRPHESSFFINDLIFDF
jgi:hypothetical protein